MYQEIKQAFGRFITNTNDAPRLIAIILGVA